MKRIITRKDLKEKLLQWQAGQMTAHDLNDWVGSNYPNEEVEYEDWDETEEFSVTNEVLAALDMMDMNLMTLEDVPAYLDFLETPPASFEEGYKELQQYLEQIDLKKRAAALVADPFYERFCQEPDKTTKDKSGNPLRVGDSIRLLSLDLSMFEYSAEEEKEDIKSMIGETFEIEEIDENGDAWITKWWERGNGEFESHSLRLAPAEMERVGRDRAE